MCHPGPAPLKPTAAAPHARCPAPRSPVFVAHAAPHQVRNNESVECGWSARRARGLADPHGDVPPTRVSSHGRRPGGVGRPLPVESRGGGTPGRGRSHPRAAPLSVSRCPVPLLTTLLPVLLGAAMTGHVTPRAFSVPDPEKIVDSVTPATRPVLFPANAGNCWLSRCGGVIYARPFLASKKQKKTTIMIIIRPPSGSARAVISAVTVASAW